MNLVYVFFLLLLLLEVCLIGAWQLVPLEDPERVPEPRQFAASCVHENRLVFWYGGISQNQTNLNDMWLLSLHLGEDASSWKRLHLQEGSAVPSAGAGSVLVCVEGDDDYSLWLYHGHTKEGGGQLLLGTPDVDAGTIFFTLFTEEGPVASDQAFTWDSKTGSLLSFGGDSAVGFLDQLWLLRLPNSTITHEVNHHNLTDLQLEWQPVDPANAAAPRPSSREGCSLSVLDPELTANSTAIALCAGQGPRGTMFTDCWIGDVVDLDRAPRVIWRRVPNDPATKALRREEHSMLTWDPRTVLMQGGETPNEDGGDDYINGVQSIDLVTGQWSVLVPHVTVANEGSDARATLPGHLFGATFVRLGQYHHTLLLMGGVVGEGRLQSGVWRWQLDPGAPLPQCPLDDPEVVQFCNINSDCSVQHHSALWSCVSQGPTPVLVALIAIGVAVLLAALSLAVFRTQCSARRRRRNEWLDAAAGAAVDSDTTDQLDGGGDDGSRKPAVLMLDSFAPSPLGRYPSAGSSASPGTVMTASTAALHRFVLDAGDVEKGERVGRGAFGEVYCGRWRGANVAVKQVRGINEAAARQLADEAVKLAQLRPFVNVVGLLGVVLRPLMLVLEFCDGGSLDDALYGEHPIELTQAQQVSISLGCARGISHLHCEQIIHRDIAARNVLLDGQFVPKITDFGMSRYKNLSAGIEEHPSSVQTTETKVGPLKYMSPEQLTDAVVSYSADVWSFGVLLYEIFARSPPFPDKTAVQAASFVAQGNSLSVPPGTPETVAALMMLCLKHTPSERPTAQEAATMLEAASALGNSSASGRSQKGRAPSSSNRSRKSRSRSKNNSHNSSSNYSVATNLTNDSNEKPSSAGDYFIPPTNPNMAFAEVEHDIEHYLYSDSGNLADVQQHEYDFPPPKPPSAMASSASRKSKKAHKNHRRSARSPKGGTTRSNSKEMPRSIRSKSKEQ